MKLELNKVYKARNGNEWKIICISAGEIYPILGVNREQNVLKSWYSSGAIGSHEDPRDLIELVGDDFTDNLREFELDGILIELIEDIQRIRNNDFIKNKVSKWHLTMKELPK